MLTWQVTLQSFRLIVSTSITSIAQAEIVQKQKWSIKWPVKSGRSRNPLAEVCNRLYLYCMRAYLLKSWFWWWQSPHGCLRIFLKWVAISEVKCMWLWTAEVAQACINVNRTKKASGTSRTLRLVSIGQIQALLGSGNPWKTAAPTTIER